LLNVWNEKKRRRGKKNKKRGTRKEVKEAKQRKKEQREEEERVKIIILEHQTRPKRWQCASSWTLGSSLVSISASMLTVGHKIS
jgi:hypothetical protein